MVLRLPQLNRMFVVTGKKEKKWEAALAELTLLFPQQEFEIFIFFKKFKAKSAGVGVGGLQGSWMGWCNTEPGEEDEGRHPAGSRSHWQSDRWRGLAWVCLRVQANASGGLGDRGFTCSTHVPTGRAHPPPLPTSILPTTRPYPPFPTPRHTHTHRAQPPISQSPRSTQQLLLFRRRVQSGQCSP